MKKTISALGIIGSILLSIGAVLKFSSLSGGIFVIALGSIILSIYIILFIIEQEKSLNTRIAKAYIRTFGIAGILMIAGLPLELIRWPGVLVIFIAFFIFFFVLLGISLTRTILEKDIELRYKYTNNFVFLLGGGIILLYPSILWITDHWPGS